jgi:DNA-binding response OmpR family regulator
VEHPGTLLLVRESSGGPGPTRILIIDDDAGLREALLAIFAAEPRYAAQVARDGPEGLARIATFRPHLVLLDLHMPGLSGADLCRAVRASPVSRAMRILAMSALPDQEVLMLAAGADAFLSKPFTLTDLEATLARLL